MKTKIEIPKIGSILSKYRFTKQLEAKAGDSPGSLVFIGKPRSDNDKYSLALTTYDSDYYAEKEITDWTNLKISDDANKVHFLEFSGTNDLKALASLGEILNVHPLTLEDICNSDHMSKLDEHENYFFFIGKLFKHRSDEKTIDIEQMSLIIKDNLVVVFTEQKTTLFDNLKKRIATSKGRIRQRKADYLAYAIIDTIVDHNIVSLEHFSETIEDMQNRLLINFEKNLINEIYLLHEQLVIISKNLQPMKEVIYNFIDYDSDIITEQTQPFIKDLYDHATSINGSIETFKETVRGMFELYHTLLSSQVNDIMRVLTIIATIFIPLTFIVGVYGMNFKYMPELEYHWGYFTILGLMAAIFVVMIFYFKNKKWL